MSTLGRRYLVHIRLGAGKPATNRIKSAAQDVQEVLETLTMIFQQVLKALVTGYLSSIHKRTQREFKQDFWYQPDELLPERFPNLARQSRLERVKAKDSPFDQRN